MSFRSIRSRVAIVLAAVSVLAVIGVSTSPAASAACPDGGYGGTPGERIKGPTNDTVYMVDPEGYKRPIVGAGNYLFLFRSWAGIKVRNDIGCIRLGQAIGGTTFIAHNYSGSYYFVEPYAGTYRARGIPSVAVYDKYFFRWDTAQGFDPARIAGWGGNTNRAWT